MRRLIMKHFKWSKKTTKSNDSEKWYDAEDQSQRGASSSASCSSEIKQIRRQVCSESREISLLKDTDRKGSYFRNLFLLKMEEEDDVREHMCSFFSLVNKLMEMEIFIDEDLLCALLLSSLPSSFEDAITPTAAVLSSLENLSAKIILEGDARCAGATDADSINAKNRNDVRLRDLIEHYNSKQLKDKKDEGQNQNYGNSELGEGAFSRFSNSSSYNYSLQEENEEKLIWYLDSGTTSHMCNDVSKFQDFKKCQKKMVRLANGQPREIIGSGTVIIRPKFLFRGIYYNLRIKDVLCVPDLRINLISVSKITDEGKKVIFDEKCARIIDQFDQEVAKGRRTSGLYFIEEDPTEKEIIKRAINYKILEWHNKLGHLDIRGMRELFQSGILSYTNLQYFPHEFHCNVCDEEKVENSSLIRSENIRAKELLEIIHIGVCGPIEVPSLGHNNYFVTFTDDLSRYTEVCFIRKKSEVFGKFIEFKIYIEAKLKCKMRFLRTEYGAEYDSKEFDDFLKYSGIRRSYKPPWQHRKPQHDVSEEKHRALLDVARCLLSQSGLPLNFWAEAINTANYIRNRCPLSIIDYMTPYEVIFKRKPCLSFLKTFGSMGFALIRGTKRENFEQKSMRCIFLGYTDYIGFRVYIPELDRLEILKNVRIIDGIFIKECEDLNNLVLTGNAAALPSNK